MFFGLYVKFKPIDAINANLAPGLERPGRTRLPDFTVNKNFPLWGKVCLCDTDFSDKTLFSCSSPLCMRSDRNDDQENKY